MENRKLQETGSSRIFHRVALGKVLCVQYCVSHSQRCQRSKKHQQVSPITSRQQKSSLDTIRHQQIILDPRHTPLDKSDTNIHHHIPTHANKYHQMLADYNRYQQTTIDSIYVVPLDKQTQPGVHQIPTYTIRCQQLPLLVNISRHYQILSICQQNHETASATNQTPKATRRYH